jgi:hypothetical protein
VNALASKVLHALLAAAWDEGHDECCAVYVRHCAHARNPYREEDS